MAYAREKQPKIERESLEPKDTIAGYRCTWQERGLIAFAELNPIDDQPAKGFLLEASYNTVSGREPGNRQIDFGTTLTSNVRELMLGQMALAGWQEIGRDEKRRTIWQHFSRIAPASSASDQAPAQDTQVSVTLDDFTSTQRNYQATAIAGDVQAIVRVYISGIGGQYALTSGVDCYPWPPAQPMTPEQHRRATALLPNLLDQVHAALQLAGWSLDKRTSGRDIELWRRPGAQLSSAPAQPREQDQAAPAMPVRQSKAKRFDTSKCNACATIQGDIIADDDEATKKRYGYLCLTCSKLVSACYGDAETLQGVLHYIDQDQDQASREICGACGTTQGNIAIDSDKAGKTYGYLCGRKCIRVVSIARKHEKKARLVAVYLQTTRRRKPKQKNMTPDQAAPVASKMLYVPAREKVKDYRRTITASEVTYTCKRCQNETTKLLFPGAIPLYCDTCAVEVKREKTRARVQRLRAGKKGGQVQAS